MIVSVSLLHPKGANIAGKYWPHSGHLGLTPLSLTGVVRARTDSERLAQDPRFAPGKWSSHTSSGPASSSSSSSSASNSSNASSSSPSSTQVPSSSVSSNSSIPSQHHQQSGRLRASAVTVALICYEAKLGRVGVVKTNILFQHVLPLWTAAAPSTPSPRSPREASSSSLVIAELPSTDFAFNLIIPPSVVAASAACSTCHFQNYRVYWRLEASKYSFFFFSLFLYYRYYYYYQYGASSKCRA